MSAADPRPPAYTEAQLFRVSVVKHDGPLRFVVPSRRQSVPPYLVELDAYRGNGQCICEDFLKRREPHLRRGLNALQAFEAGLIKIPKWGTVEDCLRYFHIHVARLKFADDVVKAMHEQRKREAHENKQKAS